MFSIGKDGRGCRFVFGSYSFTDSAPIYTSFVPSLTGEHVVTVAVVGSTFKVTVDGTTYEKSGERVASSEYDRAIMTVAPVSIHSVTLTDDTASSALWSAGYSELYNTNIPTPSSIPRNFAEEPAVWHNAKAWFDNAPAGTMTFDFEFEQLSVPITGKTGLLHNGGNSPFGCEWIISSADRFAFRIYFYGLYDTGAIHAPYLQVILNASTVLGKHLVHAEASDGLFTVTMDGTTVSNTRIGDRLTGSFTGVQKTTADCNISRLSIATPGYPKFSYPSESERLRLITKTNVRTDRGYFEQADKASSGVRWGNMVTALDLRGSRSDWTFLADCEFGSFSPEQLASGLWWQSVMVQGSIANGASDCFKIVASVNNGAIRVSAQVLFDREDGSYLGAFWIAVPSTYLASIFDRRLRLALVIDWNARRLMLYLDGLQVATAAIPTGAAQIHTPPGTTPRSTNLSLLGLQGESGSTYNGAYLPKLYAALAFDRAMAADEIHALCQL